RNVKTSKRRNYVETSKLRQNVEITLKHRNYIEMSKLRRNVEITNSKILLEFLNYSFEFYFVKYVIRFWKKIYSIFSCFQNLFHKLCNSTLEENSSDFFAFSNFISRIIYLFWKKI